MSQPTLSTSAYSTYLIGLDPGQAQDYSAFSVIERAYVPNGKPFNGKFFRRQRQVYGGRQPVKLEYRVVHLERAELGTLYTRVGARVLELIKALPTKEPVVAIDHGGVGRAVVDIIHQTLAEGLEGTAIRAHTLAVAMHGGDRVIKVRGGARAPKRDVVSSPLVLMQRGALKVAQDLTLRDVLVNEMKNFKVKIDPRTAHDSYTHWRENQHDDLLFAVAFPIWTAETYLKTITTIDHPEQLVEDAPITYIGKP